MGAKKPIPVPEDLTDEEKRMLIRWCRREYPNWVDDARDGYQKLKFLVGESLDYWRARSNPHGYSDFLAVARNRIRYLEANGIDLFSRKHRGNPERPQEVRARAAASGEPTVLAEIIKLEEWREG